MYKKKGAQHTTKTKTSKAIDLVIFQCFFILEFTLEIVPFLAVFDDLQ